MSEDGINWTAVLRERIELRETIALLREQLLAIGKGWQEAFRDVVLEEAARVCDVADLAVGASSSPKASYYARASLNDAAAAIRALKGGG